MLDGTDARTSVVTFNLISVIKEYGKQESRLDAVGAACVALAREIGGNGDCAISILRNAIRVITFSEKQNKGGLEHD